MPWDGVQVSEGEEPKLCVVGLITTVQSKDYIFIVSNVFSCVGLRGQITSCYKIMVIFE